MLRVKWNGIEIECETVPEVAVVLDMLSRRHTGEAPRLAAPRKAAAKNAAKPPHGIKRRGRVPSIDEALARKLHARYAAGESLTDLAAAHKIGSGGTLYARFKALELPTGPKARAAALTVPIKRIPPGQGRPDTDKTARA